MDTEKLSRWAKVINDNATAHGWHEEKHSPEHYLALVMCEVADAIEADRNDRKFIKCCCVPNDEQYFVGWYNEWVKGTTDEEFADIVIRLLDMKIELNLDFKFFIPYSKPCKELSLAENLWFFVKYKLYHFQPLFNEAIVFIYDLAEQLDIDLDQHIEWKMKYNESRPYKHGSKKY